MQKILITGPSGSGKSALIREIQRTHQTHSKLEVLAIDSDNYPGLCRWYNKSKDQFSERTGPMDRAWLSENVYVWDPAVLQDIFSSHSDMDLIIICGLTVTTFELSNLFDLCCYLEVSDSTAEKRLKSRKSETYAFGNNESELKVALEYKQTLDQAAKDQGCILLNNEGSIESTALHFYALTNLLNLLSSPSEVSSWYKNSKL